MLYVTLELCRKEVFPFIHQELTDAESAADYEYESEDMAELEKVLIFVRHDAYYPTFADKAAYLICSIAGSQYFSNGNKRLSVTALLKFLVLNRIPIRNIDTPGFREILTNVFPMSH